MSRRRSFSSRFLLVLGVLLAVLAILGAWVKAQLLDTQRFVDTSAQVLAQAPVQRATAAYLADVVAGAPGIDAALQSALPPQAQRLAAPLKGIVAEAADRGAQRALQSNAFQELWRRSNLLMHRQFARIANGELKGHRALVIDLRPMAGRLATRIGFGERVVSTLPQDRTVIRVLSADDVDSIRSAVRILRATTFLLAFLSIAALLGSAFLAPTRPGGFAAAGAGLLIAGLLVLVARRVIGNGVIDHITGGGTDAAAGQSTWWILTAFLADVAGAVALLGALILAGGWLAGGSAWAARVRGPVASFAAAKPIAVHAVVAVAILVLIGTSLLPWSASVIAAIVYLAGGVAFVEALRRTPIAGPASA